MEQTIADRLLPSDQPGAICALHFHVFFDAE